MEDAEKYIQKIESMKKYVPLLSKLITQLEEKNENTAESIKKITQLKILQQQLCDQKPGILLEELNKCEQVLENLFELHENVTNDETETIPQANEAEEEGTQETSILKYENLCNSNKSDCDISKNSMDTKEEIDKTIRPHANAEIEVRTREASVENCKSIKNSLEAETESTSETGEVRISENTTNNEISFIPQTEDNSKQDIQKVSTFLLDNNEQKVPTLHKENYDESNTSINKKEKNENKTQDTEETSKDTQKTEGVILELELTNNSKKSEKEMLESVNKNISTPFEKQNGGELDLSESFEEKNVEIIEFSESENESECDDEGELILPDEENPFVKQSYENNETVLLMDRSKITEELEELHSEGDNTNEQPKEPRIHPNLNKEENEKNHFIKHTADPVPVKFNNKITENFQDKTEKVVTAQCNINIEGTNSEKTETPQSNIDLEGTTFEKTNASQDNILSKENTAEKTKAPQNNILFKENTAEKTETPQNNINFKETTCKINETLQSNTNLKESTLENRKLIESQEQHEHTNSSERIENAATVLQNKDHKINIDESSLNQSGQKRSAPECTDDSTAKKQKVSDNDEFSIDNEEFVADPLAIDNRNNITKSDHENDNDDVEIIEQRNSPILIDSDDDVKVLEPIEKQPIKRPSFAFKSTNPNKNRHRIIIHSKGTPKPVSLQFLRKPTPKHPPLRNQQSNFLSNMDLQPSQGKSTNPRHFRACVGQKKIIIPNAFYGSARQNHTIPEQNTITDKLVSTPPINAGPDAAHCRWLDNFLNNFCSPHNKAHNTAYLILKRALRQEDYERICRQRVTMNPFDKDINMRLLCQLRNIFYLHGNHKLQKLTFVGRKFCQLAFVNIMDKTISLTTNNITNEVTSRTRISAATLETARSEMLTSTSSMSNTTATSLFQVSTVSKTPSAIIDTSQSSLSLRKRHEDDTEYCPPHEITNPSSECSPRRSLRTSAQRRSTSESLKMFTYSETDDDDNTVNETSPQEQQKQEKGFFTAATEAYIIQKRLAAQQEREKQAKSFETAFTDTIAQNTDPFKVFTSTTSESFSSNTLNETNAEILVISDDEDDVQQIPLEELTEPKPHLIHKASGTVTTNIGDTYNTSSKTQVLSNGLKHHTKNGSNNEQEKDNMKKVIINGEVKNTSPEVHSMSRYNDYCLLCNRAVTRVVGHYVNNHPESEVFISRPSPKMAHNMLNNKLGPAAYDRLQNRLSLYIATCVFCEKKGSFTLPYWYQHFASHTGEYAYQCTGCGLRKPTRSQLSLHVRQNCTQNGDMLAIEQFDFSSLKINAYTCRLCNYTQMNLANVLKHLQNQHDITPVEKSNWMNVTLLEIPPSVAKGKQLANATNKPENARFYVHSENNEIFEIAEIEDTNYIENNDGQPVVVNEAETDWYEDSTAITNTIQYMGSNTDYQMRN